ncbi:MAG: aminoacetone oxidase family FAD-binding enzyme [Clostridia bacterium]|nr:aminoacetone oxidase family FAD-binding enzyme [Clostridia bacterium]
MKHYHVAIIGGGASGLALALFLSRKGISDLVLIEKNDRLGRKLSATGNGQGNLTNLSMGKEHYFSSDLALAEEIISSFDERDTISFFASLGGLLLPDDRGRVYPASRQASSATDLLRYALQAAKIECRLSTTVRSLSHPSSFVIETDKGALSSDFAVLCTGGKAAPQFGTDGSAYALAEGFGHTLTELFPSLVQCKADMGDKKGLKGIRVDGRLSYLDHTVRGDVIFTDYGLSGDAVFRLSPYFAGKDEAWLYLELLPDVEEETLLSLVKGKNVPKEEAFCGILTNQIGRMLLKSAGSLEGAVRLCKRIPFRVTGTLGFAYAQVTKGGIPMNEVTKSLESKKQRGLFFCGEILDVDGECGGYNLQWAFSSAHRVAEEVCRR